MNIQHLRYAVEVEKTRSITEAAENLYMSQPNLSRAIHELESALDFQIFERTPKGVNPTEKGEEFLQYARSVLAQFDELVELYEKKAGDDRVMRLSVPRSSYIAEAFTRFAQLIGPGTTLDYKETNALRAIRNVVEDGYDIGIVRYQADYEKYFLNKFRENGLQYQELWSFRYLAMMRADHPAARKQAVTLRDLWGGVGVGQGDLFVPSMPKVNLMANNAGARLIHTYDRTSQFELLAALPNAYAWVAPVPEKALRRYGLVLRPCEDYAARHKDTLIYRRQYMLSPTDEMFLEQLACVHRELEPLFR